MAWLLPSIWQFGRLFGRPLIKQTFGNYQLRVQHLNKLNCTPSTKQCQSTKHCLSQLLPMIFILQLGEEHSMKKNLWSPCFRSFCRSTYKSEVQYDQYECGNDGLAWPAGFRIGSHNTHSASSSIPLRPSVVRGKSL